MNPQTKETKHTPGPWTIHGNVGKNGNTGILADKAPCIIAIMGNEKQWPAEALANAQFIVQACNAHENLLTACGYLLSRLKHYTNGQESCDMPVPDERAIAFAEKAIRQATGGDK